jgi:hypothetical protein
MLRNMGNFMLIACQLLAQKPCFLRNLMESDVLDPHPYISGRYPKARQHAKLRQSGFIMFDPRDLLDLCPAPDPVDQRVGT